MSNILKNISKQVSNLFRVEEVEVTFKVVNNRVVYTYTKVGR